MEMKQPQAPAAFLPQKWPPGAHYVGNWVDVFEEEKNPLPLPGFELQIVQPLD
jgi:hypothetical protein